MHSSPQVWLILDPPSCMKRVWITSEIPETCMDTSKKRFRGQFLRVSVPNRVPKAGTRALPGRSVHQRVVSATQILGNVLQRLWLEAISGGLVVRVRCCGRCFALVLFRDTLGCEAMDCIKATTSAALYPWRQFWRLHQIYLDKTVLHLRRRWLVTAALASIFALRVFYLRGFYAVSICLCSDEFQPFIGRLSEFQLDLVYGGKKSASSGNSGGGSRA
ncbi:Retrieval of early ER protein Rer1 [Artemisia annua]|uniref:Retrieval of early ER protein Rer1 n=1 Tax=Artemisia annua TaxID=35608 RepID=A0A2U1L7H2_ARTAN|nr:Retrieval of early ER protein Rer1 [Artemisia annua]